MKWQKKHTCLTNNYIYWWTDNIYQRKNKDLIQLNVCYNIKHGTIHFQHSKLSKIVSQHACHNYIVLIFSLCLSKIYQHNLRRYTRGTWLYTIYIIDLKYLIYLINHFFTSFHFTLFCYLTIIHKNFTYILKRHVPHT